MFFHHKKRGEVGGLNLFQRKEPAFSREQKRLLYPEVLYIPVEPGMDQRMASAFLDDATFLGLSQLDYPGVTHTEFGRYSIGGGKRSGHAEVDNEQMNFDGELPVLLKQPDYEDLVNIAKRAFIIDETDGMPLFKKLQSFHDNEIRTIVADAVDEEPYVSSSVNTLLQKGGQVMNALQVVGEALHATHLFSVVYADLDDTRTVIPQKIGNIPVQKVAGKYPVRKRLSAKLNRKNPGEQRGLIGVQALLHLYRAVYFGKKQSTTIVTVAGDCIGYSCNVEVAIGTTIRELLVFCGLVRDPARVIIQGSIQGVAMTNLDLPILHSEKAVLAFEEEVVNKKLPCINCGRCTTVCPVDLSPVFIYKYMKAGQREAAKKLKAERCLECGCCSYTCPARLELSAAVTQLKHEILDAEKEGDA